MNVRAVEKEVLVLAVRDPVVYATFQSCLLENLISDVNPMIIEAFSDSERMRCAHRLWSTALAYKSGFFEHRSFLGLKETLR